MRKKHINDEELFFYLTGDLDHDTITGLEKHIQDCPQCRNRLAREQVLFNSLKKSEYPVPDKRELKKLRKRLTLSLKQTIRDDTGRSFSLREAWQSLFSSRAVLKFAAGGALFLSGLLLGFIMAGSGDSSVQEILNSNTTRYEKISFQSGKSDEVALVVEQNSLHTFRLSADDPRLIQAAINILENDERDNMRLKAVKILQNARRNKEVEFALVERLQTDSNPGIRLHAIQILKKFPLNQMIKDVLVSVLFKDTNSGVRYEARQHLEEFGGSADTGIKKNLTI